MQLLGMGRSLGSRLIPAPPQHPPSRKSPRLPPPPTTEQHPTVCNTLHGSAPCTTTPLAPLQHPPPPCRGWQPVRPPIPARHRRPHWRGRRRCAHRRRHSRRRRTRADGTAVTNCRRRRRRHGRRSRRVRGATRFRGHPPPLRMATQPQPPPLPPPRGGRRAAVRPALGPPPRRGEEPRPCRAAGRRAAQTATGTAGLCWFPRTHRNGGPSHRRRAALPGIFGRAACAGAARPPAPRAM